MWFARARWVIAMTWNSELTRVLKDSVRTLPHSLKACNSSYVELKKPLGLEVKRLKKGQLPKIEHLELRRPGSQRSLKTVKFLSATKSVNQLNKELCVLQGLQVVLPTKTVEGNWLIRWFSSHTSYFPPGSLSKGKTPVVNCTHRDRFNERNI